MARLIVHDSANTKVRNPGILSVQKRLIEQGVKLANGNVDSELITDIDILFGIDYFNKIVMHVRRVHGITSFITPAGVIPFGLAPSWATGNSSSSNDFCLQSSVICNRVIEQQRILYDEQLNREIEQL